MSFSSPLIEKLRSSQEKVDKFDLVGEILRLYRANDSDGFTVLIEAFTEYQLRILAGKGKSKAEIIQLAHRNLDIACVHAEYENKGESVFDAEAEQKKTLYHLLEIGPVRAFYHQINSYSPPIQLRGMMRTLFDNEVYYRDHLQAPSTDLIKDAQRQLVLFRKFTCPSFSDILETAPLSAVSPFSVSEKSALEKVLDGSSGKKYLQIIFAAVPLSVIAEGVAGGNIDGTEWYHAAASASITGLSSPLQYTCSFGLPYRHWSLHGEIFSKEISQMSIPNAEEMSRILESARSGFQDKRRYSRLRDVSSDIRGAYAQKMLHSLQQLREKQEAQDVAQQFLQMIYLKPPQEQN